MYTYIYTHIHIYMYVYIYIYIYIYIDVYISKEYDQVLQRGPFQMQPIPRKFTTNAISAYKGVKNLLRLFLIQFGTRTCHFACICCILASASNFCMVFATCWYFKPSWPLILRGICYMLVLQAFMLVSLGGHLEYFKMPLVLHLGFL